MVKPNCRTDSPTYQKGYQQALEDFAVAPLLTYLKTYSAADFHAAWMNLTQPELESLATILIRELTTNLKGKAIAGYLNAIRHGSTDIPSSLVHLAFPSPSIDLPANFPDVQIPRYLYGDKLRWIPESDSQDNPKSKIQNPMTGVLQLGDSTALLPTTVLGRGAISSGSTNSPPVPLGQLPIQLGRTTSNPWRMPHEAPSSHRTRTNPDRPLRLLSTGDDSATVLHQMASESRGNCLHLLSFHVYRPRLVQKRRQLPPCQSNRYAPSGTDGLSIGALRGHSS